MRKLTRSAVGNALLKLQPPQRHQASFHALKAITSSPLNAFLLFPGWGLVDPVHSSDRKRGESGNPNGEQPTLALQTLVTWKWYCMANYETLLSLARPRVSHLSVTLAPIVLRGVGVYVTGSVTLVRDFDMQRNYNMNRERYRQKEVCHKTLSLIKV